MALNTVNVLDFGAVADATYYRSSNGRYYSNATFTVPATDSTYAINSAIQHAFNNSIENVIIPAGTYLINPLGTRTSHLYEVAATGGIRLASGIHLKLDPNAILVQNPTTSQASAIISINNKSNVTISGGKLSGDMLTHANGTDFHNECYGIIVANACKNVIIKDMEIYHMEDDAIMISDYIQSASGGLRADTITVQDCNLHDNGRQGVTIASGSNIIVTRCTMSRMRKWSPMSGIDIELEGYNHVGVSNVEISNNTFIDNGFSGVVVSDMFITKPNATSTNINIRNNTFKNNRYGVIVPGRVIGLNIIENDIEANHDIPESTIAIGSTEKESQNVSIRGNKITAYDKNTFTIGIMSFAPNTLISTNLIDGLKDGIYILNGATLMNNTIKNIINEEIHYPNWN